MSLFEKLEELKEELRQLQHQFNQDGIIDDEERKQLDDLNNVIIDLGLQYIDEQNNTPVIEEEEVVVDEEQIVFEEEEAVTDKFDHQHSTEAVAADNPAPKNHNLSTEYIVPTQDNSNQILSLFLRGEGDEDGVAEDACCCPSVASAVGSVVWLW